MSTPGYAIGWEAGASAQIELFSPELDANAVDYRLKFTPPMRRTIRPPLTELRLGRGELGPIADALNKLAGAIDARGAAGGGAAGAAPASSIVDQAKNVGGLLFSLVVPNDVQIELGNELFLEIGLDEALLVYPWELLHDGEEFLCLKHSIGRFVNVSKQNIPSQSRPEIFKPQPLSVLLISVSHPQPRSQNEIYDPLPGVDEEAKAITDALAGLGNAASVEPLAGPNATWDKVANKIKSRRFNIVHYSGHAFFDNDRPYNSSLVLHDQNMSTGHIMKFFGKEPPVLFFINGCESAATRGTGENWKSRYDIFGLSRAFLETGAYLLGSRWKVGDIGATEFAKEFYSNLIQEKPLGRTIRDSRIASKTAHAEAFAWASYIYYGDPRLRFSKT